MKFTKKQKSKLIEALAIIGSLAVIFSVIFSFGYADTATPGTFFLGGLLGAYLGFAALPFFDKKYKPMPWTCAFLAGLGVFLLLSDREMAANWKIVTVGVSFVVGYYAPKWAKYM